MKNCIKIKNKIINFIEIWDEIRIKIKIRKKIFDQPGSIDLYEKSNLKTEDSLEFDLTCWVGLLALATLKTNTMRPYFYGLPQRIPLRSLGVWRSSKSSLSWVSLGQAERQARERENVVVVGR